MPKKVDMHLLRTRIQCLALYRPLLQDEVIVALLALLDGLESEDTQRLPLYSGFVAAVYRSGGDLGNHLLPLVLEMETPITRLEILGKPVPQPMADSLIAELGTFSLLTALNPLCISEQVGSIDFLPTWQNSAYNFNEQYAKRRAEISTKGFGIFVGNRMFTLGSDGAVHPVYNPDAQRLSGLTGYKREREQIVINTNALLKGIPANNILLYGDAGTGKSSTVKALANEYYDKGLRLVEVRKNQLYLIPGLMGTLALNPLKFILFIDDLSFPADDKSFTELKAILEGNVSARPSNIVVYATSNRRHMVKERFSDRQGDDLHRGDTMEEEASLAARFGLTITFLKPDRDMYIQIVMAYAEEFGLKLQREALIELAEAHAIRYGGRSPRAARQFVEYRKAVEEV